MKLSAEELDIARNEYITYVDTAPSEKQVLYVTSAASWARVFGRGLLDTIAHLEAENRGLAMRANAAERERDAARRAP